jgi:hypothetical protein
MNFVGGVLSGLVVAMVAVGIVFLVYEDRSEGWQQSHIKRELSIRIESIPINDICNALFLGKPIIGEDHVTVWNNKKRYLAVAWKANKEGVPVFYWTSADLPTDVPECNSLKDLSERDDIRLPSAQTKH